MIHNTNKFYIWGEILLYLFASEDFDASVQLLTTVAFANVLKKNYATFSTLTPTKYRYKLLSCNSSECENDSNSRRFDKLTN